MRIRGSTPTGVSVQNTASIASAFCLRTRSRSRCHGTSRRMSRRQSSRRRRRTSDTAVGHRSGQLLHESMMPTFKNHFFTSKTPIALRCLPRVTRDFLRLAWAGGGTDVHASRHTQLSTSILPRFVSHSAFDQALTFSFPRVISRD